MRRTPPVLLVPLAATALLLGPAPAAQAVVDPAKMQVLESVQKLDPVVMANCTTGGIANPVGAVTVPPEAPLVGCLTL